MEPAGPGRRKGKFGGNLRGSRATRSSCGTLRVLSSRRCLEPCWSTVYRLVGLPCRRRQEPKDPSQLDQSYVLNLPAVKVCLRRQLLDFQPSSVIFKPHQAPQVILSTIGVGIWAAAIAWSINVWGFVNVFKIYLVPYIWTVHWLVFVTYLQHTDPSLPHYDVS